MERLRGVANFFGLPFDKGRPDPSLQGAHRPPRVAGPLDGGRHRHATVLDQGAILGWGDEALAHLRQLADEREKVNARRTQGRSSASWAAVS
jgi:hypothetical protein